MGTKEILEEENETTEKKRYSILKIFSKVFAILLIILSVMLVYVYHWTVEMFGEISFAQVMFHLLVPMEGTDTSLVLSYFKGVWWIVLVVLLVAYMPFIPDKEWWKSLKSRLLSWYENRREMKKNKKAKMKKSKMEKSKMESKENVSESDSDDTESLVSKKEVREESIVDRAVKGMCRFLRRFYTRHFAISAIIILVCVIVYDVRAFGIDEWLADRFDSNTIFEDHYIDSATANITFPDKKKNLIIILAESLESTFADKESGGVMAENFIPNLTKFAKENTHFSSKNNLIGATEVPGTTFTLASMVAQTSGVPFIVPIGDNSYADFTEFMPGVTTMGQILAKEGYTNHLILGSSSEFAGIDTYFKTHGDYEIFDYSTAVERGYIDEDYHVFWGFEDKKVFDYAKDELLEVAKQEQPFNMIINTIDLHTPNGYRCQECGYKYYDEYKDGYKDIILCQDRLISEFVEWAKMQDFYEDTVIVVTGDHLSMASIVRNAYVNSPDYERTTYHCIINSDLEPVNNTNRIFSTMDMYPTIMAAIGCKIEGERLGIGTNLYSGEPTLMESMGKEVFIEEIAKNSILYNRDILRAE